MTGMRVLRATQSLAVNAVSIYGVFGADWPVGTAIALYWAENVVRLILMSLVVRGQRRLLGFAVLFNAVHAIFLAVILGGLIPRAAPAERFERRSFVIGLAIIGALLLLELAIWIWSKQVPRVERYFARVVVVHLTIVFGMFGLVMFKKATILFGVFAAMKVIVDLLGSRGRDTQAAVLS